MAATHYDMGLSINGSAIPDPSGWSFSIEDLDTSAERNAEGTLSRSFVAQKINYSFSYKAITAELLGTILGLLNASMFTVVAPDPYSLGSVRSGAYYAGKRSGETILYSKSREEVGLFDLSFNLIQY
jgi:hypothetical protein